MAIDETSHYSEDEPTPSAQADVKRKHGATTEELEATYVVDVNEASQALGVSLARLSQLTTKGTLSHVRKRVGARWRIFYRREEIDELARLHRAAHFPRTMPPTTTQAIPQGNMAGRASTSDQTLSLPPKHEAAANDQAANSFLAGHGRGEAFFLSGFAEGRPCPAHQTRFPVPVPVSHSRTALINGYGGNRLRSARAIAEEDATKHREEEGITRLEALLVRSTALETRLHALEHGFHALRMRGSKPFPPTPPHTSHAPGVAFLPGGATALGLAEQQRLSDTVSSFSVQAARLAMIEASLATLLALLNQRSEDPGLATHSAPGSASARGAHAVLKRTTHRARTAHGTHPIPRVRYVK